MKQGSGCCAVDIYRTAALTTFSDMDFLTLSVPAFSVVRQARMPKIKVNISRLK